jgi:arylsulfatase A-like enzyme
MEQVDKLTMELLMNKSQYTKYLATQDPAKYAEVKEHQDKVEEHKDRIMELTLGYCDDKNKQVTTELDDAFRDYVKTCIKYLEMKAMENNYNDVLFSEEQQEESESDEDVVFKNVATLHSFWGKGARQMR